MRRLDDGWCAALDRGELDREEWIGTSIIPRNTGCPKLPLESFSDWVLKRFLGGD